MAQTKAFGRHGVHRIDSAATAVGDDRSGNLRDAARLSAEQSRLSPLATLAERARRIRPENTRGARVRERFGHGGAQEGRVSHARMPSSTLSQRRSRENHDIERLATRGPLRHRLPPPRPATGEEPDFREKACIDNK